MKISPLSLSVGIPLLMMIYSCSAEVAEAEFIDLTKYTLRISASKGGVVSPKASGTYYKGATITITATPDMGYEFDRWEGSDHDDLANGCWSRPGNCRTAITLYSDRDVQAFFKRKSCRLYSTQ